MKEKINSLMNKLYDHFDTKTMKPECRSIFAIMIVYILTTVIVFSCIGITDPKMFSNNNGWELESTDHITLEYIDDDEDTVPFDEEDETTIEVYSRTTEVTEMTTEEYNEHIDEDTVPFDEEDETTIEVYEWYDGVILSGDIEIEQLKSTIDIIAPELSGIEEAVLDIYNTTGLDPFFQIAIFCLESGYGTSDLAKYKNNIAGWNAYPVGDLSSYENATHFESLADCATTVGEHLYSNYVQQGYTTIDSISQKYCPPNSYAWSSSVESIRNRIEDTYYSLT